MGFVQDDSDGRDPSTGSKTLKPKILLAVPTGTGWVHKHVCFAVIKLLQDRRVDITPMFATHRPYVNNLHLIQQDFLAGEYDYLITMDDDNPPTNNIIDLVFLDKDVMAMPTPVWHCDPKNPGIPFYFNVMMESEDGYKPLASTEHYKGIGLYEIDAAGSGCLLIARRVLEKMQAPFMRTWNEKGIVEMGGDFSFCRRAKEEGFEIWTHLDYPCLHFKELEINEVINAFSQVVDG